MNSYIIYVETNPEHRILNKCHVYDNKDEALKHYKTLKRLGFKVKIHAIDEDKIQGFIEKMETKEK
jgi:hypothetical protein